jgi:hypothetical protein
MLIAQSIEGSWGGKSASPWAPKTENERTQKIQYQPKQERKEDTLQEVVQI